jgi:hypothetical protein
MEELTNDFKKLLNDSPIDEANRAQAQSHIEGLVKEELHEGQQGFINTDKGLLTIRIKDAATSSIKKRMSRWVESRNDVILRTQTLKSKSRSSEVDNKERELIELAEEAKTSARENYMRNHDYNNRRNEFDKASSLYDTMNAEMGGKPPVKSKLGFYVFSILLIGFVEWFINFSTFTYKYPSGIAFGITVLVALSIAIASHYHGALIKQRLALFASHRKGSEKRQVIYYQLLFTVLLIIALGVVTNARYDVLMGQMVNSGGAALPGLPGMNEQASSVWNELIPFVLMNILVWLIGIAISFLIHDSRPDYQESYAYYEKARKRFNIVDKGLKDEEKRIEAEFGIKIKAVKNTHAARINDVEKIQEYIDRLAAKEEGLVKQAVGVINETLERHQSTLVAAMRQEGLENVKFGPKQLSIDDYLNKDLRMTEVEIRKLLYLEGTA